MNLVERSCCAVRRSRLLRRADGCWNVVRPVYDRLIMMLGRRGLERTINGTDSILVIPSLRRVEESYEPNVWSHIMREIRPDDVLADVGAYIGLYTVAMAKRLGPLGKVYAFEPEPTNFGKLAAQVDINGVGGKVELVHAAVGVRDGDVPFIVGRRDVSRIYAGEADYAQLREMYPDLVTTDDATEPQSVRSVCLDTLFAHSRLDMLKIDVEGYEQGVLEGGRKLLGDQDRSPRVIFMECHPYVWDTVGTTSDSLLGLLEQCQYDSFDTELNRLTRIDAYDTLIARKRGR